VPVVGEVVGVLLMEIEGARSQAARVHTKRQRRKHSFREYFDGIIKFPYNIIEQVTAVFLKLSFKNTAVTH